MKCIAIKTSYIGCSGRRHESTDVLTGYDPHKHSLSKVIETFQRKFKRGYQLERIPSISYCIADNFIDGMVRASNL